MSGRVFLPLLPTLLLSFCSLFDMFVAVVQVVYSNYNQPTRRTMREEADRGFQLLVRSEIGTNAYLCAERLTAL
jgi:hypothetical protein